MIFMVGKSCEVSVLRFFPAVNAAVILVLVGVITLLLCDWGSEVV